MPAVTRELSITYAGVTVGGASDNYLLMGSHKLDISYERGRLTAQVVARADSAANLAGICATLESAFRKPYQDTTVSLDGNTFISWGNSANTGMLAQPSIRKIGSDFDSGRARLYEIEVEVTLPADLTGKDSLREAEAVVSRAPDKRRTVGITGTYIAKTGTAAEAQVRAQVDGVTAPYTKSILDLVDSGAEWEQRDFDYRFEDENKIARFSVTVEEVRDVDQASGQLNHPALKHPEIRLQSTRVAPGDSRGEGGVAERLTEVTCSYEAWVDRDETTDLDGLYEDTVRPYLLELIEQAVDGNQGFALVRDTGLRELAQAFRVGATITMMAATSSLVQQTITSRDRDEHGILLVPVHDGNKFARYKYDIFATRTRVEVDTKITITGSGGIRSGRRRSSGGGGGGGITAGVASGGLQGGLAAGGSTSGGAGGPQGAFLDFDDEGGGASGAGGTPFGGSQQGASSFPAGFFELATETHLRPFVMGLSDRELFLEERTIIREFEYAEPVGGGGSTSGGDEDDGEGDTTARTQGTGEDVE